jgi:hypothetical protein
MGLDKAGLESALKAAFDDMRDNKTTDEAAQQLADAIDAYIRTATVTVAAGQAFTGTSTGGPVTGTTTSTATGSLG